MARSAALGTRLLAGGVLLLGLGELLAVRLAGAHEVGVARCRSAWGSASRRGLPAARASARAAIRWAIVAS